jgi:hypothetical protein
MIGIGVRDVFDYVELKTRTKRDTQELGMRDVDARRFRFPHSA